MAVTRLKRKVRRNKARAKNRINRIKQLTRKPVIKKLDGEEQPVAAQKPEKKAAAVSASEEEE